MKKNTFHFFIDVWNTIKRAFEEFLKVPTIFIVSFFVLAFVTNKLDHAQLEWLKPLRMFMKHKIFSDAKGTSSLLGAVAGSLITVSSLTITLLLLVVQQSATTMTTRVFDQFLRSQKNQSYFGFFVGLTLYSLIILATVADPFNPILGATVTLLLTIAALYFLIILVYTTIDEMRPPVIIEAIYQHILQARKKEGALLNVTRRTSVVDQKIIRPVPSSLYGYIVNINVKRLDKLMKELNNESEVIYHASVGDYIAVHEVFAHIKTATNEDAEKLLEAILSVTDIQKQRKTKNDPGDAIEQLEIIAWTSVSTAKSNPYPGLLTVRTMRNLISVWDDDNIEPGESVYSIVYNSDAKKLLFNSLETLAIASSESMQHMVFTEVLNSFSHLFERLAAEEQRRVEDIILRILSCMGDLVLTGTLEAALENIAGVLHNCNCAETADAVLKAKSELAKSIGKLNSRSTRVGK